MEKKENQTTREKIFCPLCGAKITTGAKTGKKESYNWYDKRYHFVHCNKVISIKTYIAKQQPDIPVEGHN